jgi:hypothetical protein
MKQELLGRDLTSAAERKSRVLQAIALEDLYWVNEPLSLRGMATWIAMDTMVNTEPILPDKEETKVVDMIQEIYQRNGWSEFYELAARYGFYYPHAQILETSSGD